jgi:uncharacterized membrane protein YbaN (DUF454 family)
VTQQQAKEILSAYRPWSADANDPEFAEALALVRQDAELARWFEEHCAVQNAIRDRLRQSAVATGLKEQIISEYKARSAVVWWRQPVPLKLAAAAAVAVILGIAALWLRPGPEPSGMADTATYRSRMVGSVLRQYAMSLETNDLHEIRAHLAQKQSPADFVLPEKLAQTPLAGCGVLKWQDKQVSMICFLTGKPLPPGGKSDLFLFVVDRNSLPDAPGTGTPEIHAGTRLITATWSVGEKTYVLATDGDADFIRSYL